MTDTYSSYGELVGRETLNRDFDFIVESRPASNIAIIAPHGGAIEYGTAELAMEIAAGDHNLFILRGLKKREPPSAGRTQQPRVGNVRCRPRPAVRTFLVSQRI